MRLAARRISSIATMWSTMPPLARIFDGPIVPPVSGAAKRSLDGLSSGRTRASLLRLKKECRIITIFVAASHPGGRIDRGSRPYRRRTSAGQAPYRRETPVGRGDRAQHLQKERQSV